MFSVLHPLSTLPLLTLSAANSSLQRRRHRAMFFSVLLLAALLLPQPACAAAPETPVYAYGESLTDAQKRETAKLLGVDGKSKEIVVKIDELNDILHDHYNYYQAYSSAYVKKDDTVQGVDVKIETPETITTITETQYENAALTAGAVHVKIHVASVKAVDGSGALAGVYKAFSAENQPLPEKNIVVAQKELKVTSAISKENRDREGFSDDLLNAAVADIKAQIQKEKADSGSVSPRSIQNIVGNVINNYNLNGILSDAQIQSLQDLMTQFSEIQLSKEQKEGIAEFGKSLIREGGKLLDNVKASWDGLDEETKSGIGQFFRSGLHHIGNFFHGLWDWIQGLFS